MGRRQLTDKIVAVVGATGGLGRPIVEGLRTRGATVVTASRSGSDLSLDVRDPGAGDLLVSEVLGRHGRLDGVVIAAGIVAFGDLAECDDIVVEELFLTNSMGPMWIARRVTPALVETQGFIVNVSGVIAETPMPGMSAYAASKAAARAAWTSLRKELRRSKVLVIDARPPHTETGLASRPLAGTAPSMPTGRAPDVVAARILDAIENEESELAGSDFADGD